MRGYRKIFYFECGIFHQLDFVVNDVVIHEFHVSA